MIFGEFCKIFIFISIEKEKNERKRKMIAWARSIPQRSSLGSEKESRRGPLGSKHFTSGTLIYFKNY
jgi:hypothetical protein